MTDPDHKDKKESRAIALALVGLLLLLSVTTVWLLPEIIGIVSTHLAPGLGLRDSAVISFFITVVLMIVFAVVSGDGLLGEIQFIIAGFFLFFVTFWLMIAWIF